MFKLSFAAALLIGANAVATNTNTETDREYVGNKLDYLSILDAVQTDPAQTKVTEDYWTA